jgi:uncharacterized ion transporter superfamily protein YfcC
MESIFIGLCILFGVSAVSMAILFLLFRQKVNNMPEGSIVYDHIEEDIVKIAQRKKRKAANAKRKSTTTKRTKESKSNDKGNSMA